jgi:hypothetical protein
VRWLVAAIVAIFGTGTVWLAFRRGQIGPSADQPTRALCPCPETWSV